MRARHLSPSISLLSIKGEVGGKEVINELRQYPPLEIGWDILPLEIFKVLYNQLFSFLIIEDVIQIPSDHFLPCLDISHHNPFFLQEEILVAHHTSF